MDWGGGTIMSVVEETDKFEFPVGIQIKVVNIFSLFNNSL
jgi:hypothetical protein